MSVPSSVAERSFLGEGTGPASWLLTTDHKRVAALYLV